MRDTEALNKQPIKEYDVEESKGDDAGGVVVPEEMLSFEEKMAKIKVLKERNLALQRHINDNNAKREALSVEIDELEKQINVRAEEEQAWLIEAVENVSLLRCAEKDASSLRRAEKEVLLLRCVEEEASLLRQAVKESLFLTVLVEKEMALIDVESEKNILIGEKEQVVSLIRAVKKISSLLKSTVREVSRLRWEDGAENPSRLMAKEGGFLRSVLEEIRPPIGLVERMAGFIGFEESEIFLTDLVKKVGVLTNEEGKAKLLVIAEEKLCFLMRGIKKAALSLSLVVYQNGNPLLELRKKLREKSTQQFCIKENETACYQRIRENKKLILKYNFDFEKADIKFSEKNVFVFHDQDKHNVPLPYFKYFPDKRLLLVEENYFYEKIEKYESALMFLSQATLVLGFAPSFAELLYPVSASVVMACPEYFSFGDKAKEALSSLDNKAVKNAILLHCKVFEAVKAKLDKKEEELGRLLGELPRAGEKERQKSVVKIIDGVFEKIFSKVTNNKLKTLKNQLKKLNPNKNIFSNRLRELSEELRACEDFSSEEFSGFMRDLEGCREFHGHEAVVEAQGQADDLKKDLASVINQKRDLTRQYEISALLIKKAWDRKLLVFDIVDGIKGNAETHFLVQHGLDVNYLNHFLRVMLSPFFRAFGEKVAWVVNVVRKRETRLLEIESPTQIESLADTEVSYHEVKVTISRLVRQRLLMRGLDVDEFWETFERLLSQDFSIVDLSAIKNQFSERVDALTNLQESLDAFDQNYQKIEKKYKLIKRKIEENDTLISQNKLNGLEKKALRVVSLIEELWAEAVNLLEGFDVPRAEDSSVIRLFKVFEINEKKEFLEKIISNYLLDKAEVRLSIQRVEADLIRQAGSVILKGLSGLAKLNVYSDIQSFLKERGSPLSVLSAKNMLKEISEKVDKIRSKDFLAPYYMLYEEYSARFSVDKLPCVSNLLENLSAKNEERRLLLSAILEKEEAILVFLKEKESDLSRMVDEFMSHFDKNCEALGQLLKKVDSTDISTVSFSDISAVQNELRALLLKVPQFNDGERDALVNQCKGIPNLINSLESLSASAQRAAVSQESRSGSDVHNHGIYSWQEAVKESQELPVKIAALIEQLKARQFSLADEKLYATQQAAGEKVRDKLLSIFKVEEISRIKEGGFEAVEKRVSQDVVVFESLKNELITVRGAVIQYYKAASEESKKNFDQEMLALNDQVRNAEENLIKTKVAISERKLALDKEKLHIEKQELSFKENASALRTGIVENYSPLLSAVQKKNLLISDRDALRLKDLLSLDKLTLDEEVQGKTEIAKKNDKSIARLEKKYASLDVSVNSLRVLLSQQEDEFSKACRIFSAEKAALTECIKEKSTAITSKISTLQSSLYKALGSLDLVTSEVEAIKNKLSKELGHKALFSLSGRLRNCAGRSVNTLFRSWPETFKGLTSQSEGVESLSVMLVSLQEKHEKYLQEVIACASAVRALQETCDQAYGEAVEVFVTELQDRWVLLINKKIAEITEALDQYRGVDVSVLEGAIKNERRLNSQLDRLFLEANQLMQDAGGCCQELAKQYGDSLFNRFKSLLVSLEENLVEKNNQSVDERKGLKFRIELEKKNQRTAICLELDTLIGQMDELKNTGGELLAESIGAARKEIQDSVDIKKLRQCLVHHTTNLYSDWRVAYNSCYEKAQAAMLCCKSKNIFPETVSAYGKKLSFLAITEDTKLTEFPVFKSLLGLSLEKEEAIIKAEKEQARHEEEAGKQFKALTVRLANVTLPDLARIPVYETDFDVAFNFLNQCDSELKTAQISVDEVNGSLQKLLQTYTELTCTAGFAQPVHQAVSSVEKNITKCEAEIKAKRGDVAREQKHLADIRVQEAAHQQALRAHEEQLAEEVTRVKAEFLAQFESERAQLLAQQLQQEKVQQAAEQARLEAIAQIAQAEAAAQAAAEVAQKAHEKTAAQLRVLQQKNALEKNTLAMEQEDVASALMMSELSQAALIAFQAEISPLEARMTRCNIAALITEINSLPSSFACETVVAKLACAEAEVVAIQRVLPNCEEMLARFSQHYVKRLDQNESRERLERLEQACNAFQSVVAVFNEKQQALSHAERAEVDLLVNQFSAKVDVLFSQIGTRLMNGKRELKNANTLDAVNVVAADETLLLLLKQVQTLVEESVSDDLAQRMPEKFIVPLEKKVAACRGRLALFHRSQQDFQTAIENKVQSIHRAQKLRVTWQQFGLGISVRVKCRVLQRAAIAHRVQSAWACMVAGTLKTARMTRRDDVRAQWQRQQMNVAYWQRFTLALLMQQRRQLKVAHQFDVLRVRIAPLGYLVRAVARHKHHQVLRAKLFSVGLSVLAFKQRQEMVRRQTQRQEEKLAAQMEALEAIKFTLCGLEERFDSNDMEGLGELFSQCQQLMHRLGDSETCEKIQGYKEALSERIAAFRQRCEKGRNSLLMENGVEESKGDDGEGQSSGVSPIGQSSSAQRTGDVVKQPAAQKSIDWSRGKRWFIVFSALGDPYIDKLTFCKVEKSAIIKGFRFGRKRPNKDEKFSTWAVLASEVMSLMNGSHPAAALSTASSSMLIPFSLITVDTYQKETVCLKQGPSSDKKGANPCQFNNDISFPNSVKKTLETYCCKPFNTLCFKEGKGKGKRYAMCRESSLWFSTRVMKELASEKCGQLDTPEKIIEAIMLLLTAVIGEGGELSDVKLTYRMQAKK